MDDRSTEQHRLECEARYWLKQTRAKPAEVDALMKRIATRRGNEAADRLRAEMRRQYKKET